jgi:diaminopimelate decarboxylase
VLELFPDSARIDTGAFSIGAFSIGALSIGGVQAARLADDHGTPLVVYCEETIRAQARAYASAAPGALVVYGTKAFANVAILRVLAEEGVGADVSTLGELAFATAAGIPGDRLVFHGNNKSVAELRAAAEAGALVVLDNHGEARRAAEAGVRRVLVRLTPGVDAATHESIQTAHASSKFGVPLEEAAGVISAARERGIEVEGVHVHIGSQLERTDESVLAVERVVAFCEQMRDRWRWEPKVVDVGGGLAVRHNRDEHPPTVEEFVRPVADVVRAHWPEARLVLEPGRSLVGRAGVTLYRVGGRKESGGVRYLAIDGGMSDNPRPQLYGARYEALLANRAGELAAGVFRVAGKHCESGDVLIDAAELPEPHEGDVLAVPATGAYTLAMGSTYNGVPRPAVVLVRDGEARVVRRRESVDDLLRYDAEA